MPLDDVRDSRSGPQRYGAVSSRNGLVRTENVPAKTEVDEVHKTLEISESKTQFIYTYSYNRTQRSSRNLLQRRTLMQSGVPLARGTSRD